tara:strand:+ start:767 stop:1123 length:357 start_codon:yes stop_codon:yes gene_type:complete
MYIPSIRVAHKRSDVMEACASIKFSVCDNSRGVTRFQFAEIKNITALREVIDRIKVKVALAKNAGVIKGRVIRLKVIAVVAPRLADDSSISLEICLSEAILASTPIGIVLKTKQAIII